ncbi:MAG: hypothetical protein ABMA01_19730 [Chthoniobacteraceae bacterium]
MKTLGPLHLIAATVVLTALSPNHARACGRDFSLCDPAGLPKGGGMLVIPTFKWDRHGGQDEFEFTTGVVKALNKRVAFDGYINFANEGDGWEVETLTPGFLFDLTPNQEKSRVHFGAFIAYKFAVNGGDKEEFISANQLDTRDQFESRIIIEADVTEKLGVVANLLTTVHEGKARWGYAAGVRYEFNEKVGGSIEAIGDFQDNGKHQIFANLWWEPKEGISYRIGVGKGLSERAEDVTILSGLVLEF